MKLLKLTDLSTLKTTIKQLLDVKKNITSDLNNIRKKISSLEKEYENLYRKPLSRKESLKKDLLALEHLHKKMKQELKSSLLARIDQVIHQDYSGCRVGSYLNMLKEDNLDTSLFELNYIAWDIKNNLKALVLFNLEEAKKVIIDIYNSITDEEWARSKTINDVEKSANRLIEIEKELTELKKLEEQIITEAHSNGIDI
ncbi:hypothetical protein ACGH6Q_12255 [Gilliamella sp. BG2]|uniref:hypothetical protein n=1 Tax=Gilliamella sp. BG2 TaxID=3351509 RepID=UPI003985AAC1